MQGDGANSKYFEEWWGPRCDPGELQIYRKEAIISLWCWVRTGVLL